MYQDKLLKLTELFRAAVLTKISEWLLIKQIFWVTVISATQHGYVKDSVEHLFPDVIRLSLNINYKKRLTLQ